MMKRNVKIPRRLLEEIDELAEELAHTNRSEFVREVLRNTTEPILTPGAQEGVSEGYADVAAERTCPRTKSENVSVLPRTER